MVIFVENVTAKNIVNLTSESKGLSCYLEVLSKNVHNVYYLF